MEKICKVCGKTFTSRRGNVKSCSADCSSILKWRHDHHEWESADGLWHGVCEGCGIEFASSHMRRYCTDDCQYRYRLSKCKEERAKIKPLCKQCGHKVPSSRQVFCCVECKEQYYKGNRIVITDDIVRVRIAERYDSIEYIGGYTGSDCWLTVKCKTCAGIFRIGERSSRKTQRASCPHCKEAKGKTKRPKQVCYICGREFVGKLDRKYCSTGCRKIAAKQQAFEQSKEKYDKNIKPRKCKCCGAVFVPEYGTRLRAYCSHSCCERYNKRHNKQIRRARKHNAFISNVSYRDIFDRDKGVCQLCGKKVKDKLKAPEQMSGTIDHIIPLALGGTHEPKNVQLAHFICNSLKGIKPMNEQLRLV